MNPQESTVLAQDFHWINESICPDPFYSEETKKDFTQGNINHCREMMVRIYYPSNGFKKLSTYYDPSIISEYKSAINQFVPSIPPSLLSTLDQVKTWDTYNLAFDYKNFPVVIFSPGYGENETSYVSLIDELVSHGYIVVALNNTFISYSVTFLPDGPTVTNPQTIQGKQPLCFPQHGVI